VSHPIAVDPDDLMGTGHVAHDRELQAQFHLKDRVRNRYTGWIGTIAGLLKPSAARKQCYTTAIVKWDHHAQAGRVWIGDLEVLDPMPAGVQ